MPAILSDAEVFGTSPGGAVLSDEEVFGGSSKKKAIGAPEELTALERFAAQLPDWMAGPSGGVRGSAVGRLAMGAADPGVAIVQAAANLVGAGDTVNKGIADTEAKYQAARKEAGSDGFDALRTVGNVAITAPAGLIGKAATTLGGMALKGAAQGAVGGALNPVTDAEGGLDFLRKKAEQAGYGAAGGAILAPAAGAVARIVSPEASRDAGLQLLREAGVRPTLGQALGGMANQIEQKSTSIPFLGDMISRARYAARDSFNDAMINQGAQSIGRRAPDSGSVLEKLSVIKAGKSADYDEVLSLVKGGVNFDTPQFNFDLSKLTRMAEALPKRLRKVFQRELDESVIGNMSPNGSMLPETFQEAVSGLKATERAWRKAAFTDPRNDKLADAVAELRKSLEGEAGRQYPKFAAVKRMVDMADSKLRPIRDAAETAKNQADGAFTPAQVKNALYRFGRKDGDEAVRLATEAQRIIGNTVPDSGTPARLMNLGAAAAGLHNPLIPAALGLGALTYAGPVQRGLVAAVSRRPDRAPEMANLLRYYLAGPLGFTGGLEAAELAR